MCKCVGVVEGVYMKEGTVLRRVGAMKVEIHWQCKVISLLLSKFQVSGFVLKF